MTSKNAIVVVIILTLLTGVATNCVTKKDGFSYECSIEISGEKLSFDIEINPNRVPPSVKISLSAFGKSFVNRFDVSGEIFIPGLVIDGVRFFLNVELNPSSDKSKLHLKIQLVANLKVTRFRVTIFDSDVKKTAFYEDLCNKKIINVQMLLETSMFVPSSSSFELTRLRHK
ncbi:uncharacterized protein LOC130612437 isoform X2 [Hydractinia symbiolongicarpus]|uniref:uncharacterized protein LOC130612437 isoform X2 n=1 Tax=Hydractinia symbiolongicarpus TaxID=13093 RepID=UPI00254C2F6D|nr:uncharacterized protein LOC130612437 isoform X2 [Hydractinia symbiolongicarpus]